MPIPSEGLDAHFLPSAGRKRETSNSIFCESAKRRPKASTALTPWYGCRVEKRESYYLFIRLTLSTKLLCALTRAYECSAKKHGSKRVNSRTLLTIDLFFNLVYARTKIHELYFLLSRRYHPIRIQLPNISRVFDS